jgi:hypothetical protein
VGFEPTRHFWCPHAFQACALSHSATRPGYLTLTEEQGFVLEPRSGESPLQHRCKGTGENPYVQPATSTEEQGFVLEPQRGESPLQHRCKGTGENPYVQLTLFNGGAGIRTLVGVSTQRLSRAPPLATRPLLQGARARALSLALRPNEIGEADGSDIRLLHRVSSWPARDRTWTLLIQSQACCQLHHGPVNRPCGGASEYKEVAGTDQVRTTLSGGSGSATPTGTRVSQAGSVT